MFVFLSENGADPQDNQKVARLYAHMLYPLCVLSFFFLVFLLSTGTFFLGLMTTKNMVWAGFFVLFLDIR